MVRNLDVEIFKKMAPCRCDFPEQQNVLAQAWTGYCQSEFGTKMLELTRSSSTSTEEFGEERFREIMLGSSHSVLKSSFVRLNIAF